MSADPRVAIACKLRSLVLSFLIPLAFLAAGGAQTQPPIFPSATFTAPVGVSTSTLATGDFNGDGLADLAYITVPASVSNGTPPSTLTVLLNQGGNAPPVPVTTSSLSGCPLTSGLYSLVSGDLNKDNKLDLMVTCPTGYIAVLLGNGDGSFQSPAYYAVSAPQTLAAPVDLNGDGYPDVVVSTYLNHSLAVAVLLNQGSTMPGALANAKSYAGPTGVNPGLTATGDFNGDGKQDVVVGGLSLTVFLGNGDGTLQTSQTLPGGSYLVTADFNHDGLADIAYVGGQSEIGSIYLQVLLGSSSGTFTTGLYLPLDANLGNPYLLLAGSTNGGNNVDLALVGNNYSSILLGDGKGGFGYGDAYTLGGYRYASEAGAEGETNLAVAAEPGFSVLAGNGDGSFQGIPRTLLGQETFATTDIYGQFVTADLNGDGLTDVAGIDATQNLVSALGRGDGTFSATSTTAGSSLGSLAAGDFNGDGKVDVVGVAASNQDSALFFYAGNGNGSFQSSGPGVDLKEPQAQVPVAGDFNGDGNLDIIVPYNLNSPSQGNGLVFLPGKGNGTFGSPISFSQQNASDITQKLLVGDLNNDKKLDLVWNGAVYLGNGDGTFQQAPLGPAGTPLAIADLNGDGIPDLLMGANGPMGVSIYAGNGNGSFQASPFYSTPLPSEYITEPASASIGDVNADGHQDIVLQYLTDLNIYMVTVLLGDGTGNFTVDSHAYYTSFFDGSTGGVLARLNNQAPKLPQDNALDYLSFSVGAVVPLLNQTNPKPAAPTLVSSITGLAVSANTANENQQLTFTATVTGFNPTGEVSFVAGGTTLGSASIADGVATLAASFAAAGTYSVTAGYSGDSENLPSSSSAVSITVAAPDFAISVSPTTADVTAGQSVAATLTITPVAGYSGTVSFSCGTLPSGAACSLAPSSVTPSGGMAATTKLTITTTAPTAAAQRSGISPMATMTWAGVVFLLLLPGRWSHLARRRMYSVWMVLLLGGGLISLSGCNSGSASTGGSTPSTPGTPAGAQTITVSAVDSASKLSHSVTLQVVVQ
jgi:Bacterial Ig-like domain (group 3)/FG-GAP-like repeat